MNERAWDSRAETRVSGSVAINENSLIGERAPAEKVQELRDRQAEIEQQIATLKTNLGALA